MKLTKEQEKELDKRIEEGRKRILNLKKRLKKLSTSEIIKEFNKLSNKFYFPFLNCFNYSCEFQTKNDKCKIPIEDCEHRKIK